MSTGIEWTDETWNPSHGCTKVSPGCEHCYAMAVSHRNLSKHHAGLTVMTEHHGPQWNGIVRPTPALLAKPLHWTKPRRVFVNSMSDLFHEKLVRSVAGLRYIAAVFAVMAATPHITYQVLTKRPEQALRWFRWVGHQAGHYREGTVLAGFVALIDGLSVGDALLDQIARSPWPLPNVWLGVSVEDQRRGDERIPVLLEIPTAVRFLSVEPMLGPIVLRDRWLDALQESVDWVICGGESGPGARPMDPAWARSLRDQCSKSEVPFLFKQWGTRDGMSKHEAGRELDGITHDGYPAVQL